MRQFATFIAMLAIAAAAIFGLRWAEAEMAALVAAAAAIEADVTSGAIPGFYLIGAVREICYRTLLICGAVGLYLVVDWLLLTRINLSDVIEPSAGEKNGIAVNKRPVPVRVAIIGAWSVIFGLFLWSFAGRG